MLFPIPPGSFSPAERFCRRLQDCSSAATGVSSPTRCQPTSSLPANANVYLYDFQAGTNILISQNPNTLQPANGASDSPDHQRRWPVHCLSQRGHRSGSGQHQWHSAVDCLRSVGRCEYTVKHRRDLHRQRGQSVADARCSAATAGRSCFASWAANLATNDFNHFSDVFAFEFLYANVTLGVPGQGPVITWPYVSGHTYQVESKDNLTDSAWQQVAGTININGNQASLTDSAPVASQRFYRVVAQ